MNRSAQSAKERKRTQFGGRITNYELHVDRKRTGKSQCCQDSDLVDLAFAGDHFVEDGVDEKTEEEAGDETGNKVPTSVVGT